MRASYIKSDQVNRKRKTKSGERGKKKKKDGFGFLRFTKALNSGGSLSKHSDEELPFNACRWYLKQFIKLYISKTHNKLFIAYP